jgi:subtilisin family serine protease
MGVIQCRICEKDRIPSGCKQQAGSWGGMDQKKWTHQVVVLANPATATGRAAQAVRRPGKRLQTLIDHARAESVFAPRTRSPAGRAASLPTVYTVMTFGDEETRDTLDMLQNDEPDSTVYVAPPRVALHRVGGATAGGVVKCMDRWGMQAIGIDSCTVDASKVRVAVVDTGVDKNHPDLHGVIDEYLNLCDGESDDDIQGHGTHVCGILAGAGHTPGGMRGASNVRLVVLKGLGVQYNATFYYRALGEAFQRASILNMSLGGPDHDPAEAILIQQALDAGALIIAASGNDDDDGSYPNYPANLNGVLAVGAINAALAKASFSNAGSHVALVAPGEDIWSTVPTTPSQIFKAQTHYAPCSGTSMATPFVTAVAARVAAASGRFQAQQVRDNLPIERCPGQSARTDDLGAGYIHWPGPLKLAVA